MDREKERIDKYDTRWHTGSQSSSHFTWGVCWFQWEKWEGLFAPLQEIIDDLVQVSKLAKQSTRHDINHPRMESNGCFKTVRKAKLSCPPLLIANLKLINSKKSESLLDIPQMGMAYSAPVTSGPPLRGCGTSKTFLETFFFPEAMLASSYTYKPYSECNRSEHRHYFPSSKPWPPSYDTPLWRKPFAEGKTTTPIFHREDMKNKKNNQKKSTNTYISPPAPDPGHGEIRWQNQSASIMWPAVSPNLHTNFILILSPFHRNHKAWI